jgi:hypothetical protein
MLVVKQERIYIYVYSTVMQNTVHNSSTLPDSAYNQTINRPINYSELTKQIVE